jgi:hypothetical protein
MKRNENRLSGVKAIREYTERPWETILPLIEEDHFPAIKIRGRWESLTNLIDEWFAEKIRNGEQNGNGQGCERP